MGLNFPNQAPTTAKGERKTDTLRRQAAAPPAYLIIFPLIPIAGAIYISSTRYSDFQHHGFDVLMSAILGSLTAWLGFRWYQMPIRRGGWAWAARSLERAFWRGLGADTYGQDRGLTVEDLEHARAAQGVADGAMLPQSVGHSGTQDHSDGSGGSYELRDLGGTMAQAPTDFTALGEDNGTRRVVRLA
ncbi:uncharacterized protein KY384_004511 [Bacidia gigantensis]|uniref:uncharacterized protein n=1 Tax=Bacidia gigantensis TaxID=2732470 RepID=UPI001D04650A|nr:uncharacterized protein KY384_004511 [Bacidia gigantensis]KAG8531153.1 hypothetical protein KY384_004511 [Bacidia gigantensis]